MMIIIMITMIMGVLGVSLFSVVVELEELMNFEEKGVLLVCSTMGIGMCTVLTF
jgi:hypothetical protein